MNSLLMQTKDASANRAPWLAAMMSVSILLAACSGDGVDIASGQRGGSDPVVVDYAIAYIKAHAKDKAPFFLYIPWIAVHHPPVAHPDSKP